MIRTTVLRLNPGTWQIRDVANRGNEDMNATEEGT